MSDIKESPCSKQSLWRNGKAPLTLMLNQHLMAFLGAALAHVSNAGEPSGWKHPCMEIYCPVRGGVLVMSYGLSYSQTPLPFQSSGGLLQHSVALWSGGYIEWRVLLRATVYVPVGFEQVLPFVGSACKKSVGMPFFYSILVQVKYVWCLWCQFMKMVS